MNIDDENKFFSSENSTFDYKFLARKIFRIWPVLLASTIIFLFAAYYWNQTTDPVYKVHSLFYIKEERSPLSLFSNVPTLENSTGDGLLNEMIIINSRPIASETLRKLDFQVEYFLDGRFRYQEIYGNSPILVEVDWKFPQVIDGRIEVEWNDNETFSLVFPENTYKQYSIDGSTVHLEQIPEKTTYKFGEWIENPYFKIKVSLTNADQSGKIYVRFRDINSLIGEYSGNLEVNQVQFGSTIIDLSLFTQNYAKGEKYLNTLMQRYLELELETKNAISENTIRFIDTQVSGIADSLSYFENRLENFRSSNMVFDLSSESSTVFERLTEYENQKAQEQFKRRYYNSLKQYLINETYSELVMPSGIGIDDPYLNSILNNLMDLQVQKSTLLATQKEASPAVIEVNKKIADLNLSIREILNNVDKNSAMLIEDLGNRIAEIESSFRDMPATQQNLVQIERGRALNENIYTYLMEKRAESAISKASNTTSNKIIEPARAGGQITPKPTRNYAIAFLLSLFIPIGVVLGRELLKTKITEIYYLERRLKIPLIGTLLENKSIDKLVVFNQMKSAITEGFRSIRSNIKFIYPKDRQLTLMITSTISGEGKTFTAINLSSAYSITGKKTLLIGCDMRKPKIFQDFDLKNDVGLSNFLSGQEDDFHKVIKPSAHENLDIMLSGPVPPNPAELLASEKLNNLIKELKNHYDVIILDTPPIGLVSETLELMAYVDLTLFVFRQNYSKKVFIESLNNLKVSKNIRNIYGIFNSVDAMKITHGYGYSYGYGYEYGKGYYESNE